MSLTTDVFKRFNYPLFFRLRFHEFSGHDGGQ